MPDYIYLLENRLSTDQQNALRHLRQAAREAGMLLFLAGDAVRDLTSGHAVRDIELVLQGNALKLRKALEKLGAKIWGEDAESRTLYLCFPGTVRVDLVSAHQREYPKPGKTVFHPASIQDDLRRRDFTANAMAISLNEGSFGLLMDPLNGAADIEGRNLRLVSNYGFLDQPALLIRASRYRARLGWDLDPRTQTRYDNAREEGVIEHLSSIERSRELEQIGHEDDGLKVLRALEADGWMQVLFPAWTSAKVDEDKLHALHDRTVELLMQGVHPDMSAAQMQLLTAKLAPKDLSALKKLMLRPGFVEEWNSLDSIANSFAKLLLAKSNQTPSVSYKLFKTHDPEAVLWLGFTTKDAAVRQRYELFLKTWPEARQRIPYALMQEMRITQELTGYKDLIEKIFLELIDGRLTTPEETRTFLEPHSPPAPPPPVTIKRSRARRGAEAKVKERSFEDEEEESEDIEEDLDDIGGDDEEVAIGLPKDEIDHEEEETDEDEEEGAAKTRPAKRGKGKPAPPAPKAAKPAPEKHEPKPAAPSRPTSGKPAVAVAKPPVHKPAASKPVVSKVAAKPAKAAARPVVKAPAKPVRKAAKVQPKPAARPAARPIAKKKPAAKPAKGTKPAKRAAPAPRKPIAKPVKKRR
ncbi:MAG: CCA tRNA nucleotidyltransferase [Acidobacteriota bacterium]|nr:CCA tRNA nucleotidyltransferase [Acidobacteriota bacterium]